MRSVFLVIRTVAFVLLVYMQLLILIFTSWNIASARSSGISAPRASVFLLVNSLLIFVLVPIAYLAELICARARLAHVRLECAWTAFMSILQLVASIDVTMNGPSMHCRTHSPWAMCASFFLLAHISWLVMLILFTYCLTLCLASATHATSLPDIWVTPVPRVPWFHPSAEASAPEVAIRAPAQRHVKNPTTSSTSSEESCAISKYIAERWEKLSCTEQQPAPSEPMLFTRGHQSLDATRPDWARLQITRRGVDHPFTMPPPKERVSPVPLALPPRNHTRQTVISTDSNSIEFGEWRDDDTHSHLSLTPRTPTVFPKSTDPDLPIPRPSLSQWVRADHGSPSMRSRSPCH